MNRMQTLIGGVVVLAAGLAIGWTLARLQPAVGAAQRAVVVLVVVVLVAVSAGARGRLAVVLRS